MGYILEVEATGDRTFIVTDVYRDCYLELCGERFSIDLIPIAMRKLCVIVGMDWMESFNAEIACWSKQVRVRTPSGRELLAQGDVTRRRVAICSTAIARRYLQHIGVGYLTFERGFGGTQAGETLCKVLQVRVLVTRCPVPWARRE